MKTILNFKRCFLFSFLSFVSFSYAGNPQSTPAIEPKVLPSQKIQKLTVKENTAPLKVEDSLKKDTKINAELKISDDQKIESLKNFLSKNPSNSSKAIELAELYFNQSQTEKATALLWQHIDTLDRKGILLLAKYHEKLQNPGEMARALNILIGRNENDVEAQTLLGVSLKMQKKNSEALESFKKALEINPKFEAAYFGIAEIYEKRSPPNLYELRILFQDMIDNIGPVPIYLHKLCDVNTRDQGAIESSLETCTRATNTDRNNPDSFVNLGVSLKLAGKTEEGIALLKKTAIKFPNSEYAQFTYGTILDEQKNSIEALKYYNSAVVADPKSARSWLGVAENSFTLKKYEEAYQSYRNACKFDRKNAVAFRRATANLRQNKVNEWLSKFESASEGCGF